MRPARATAYAAPTSAPAVAWPPAPGRPPLRPMVQNRLQWSHTLVRKNALRQGCQSIMHLNSCLVRTVRAGAAGICAHKQERPYSPAGRTRCGHATLLPGIIPRAHDLRQCMRLAQPSTHSSQRGRRAGRALRGGSKRLPHPPYPSLPSPVCWLKVTCFCSPACLRTLQAEAQPHGWPSVCHTSSASATPASRAGAGDRDALLATLRAPVCSTQQAQATVSLFAAARSQWRCQRQRRLGARPGALFQGAAT